MKKFKYLSLVLVFVLLTLIGCTGKEQNKESANSGKLEDVDLVLDWYPNAIHSFIYVAMEKGYFKDEGLKVNI